MEVVTTETRRSLLESVVSATSTALKSFPRLANGLTPDAVRATPEYHSAKAQYAKAFRALREFNQQFVKQGRKSKP